MGCGGIALIEAFPRELSARAPVAGSVSPVDPSLHGDEPETAPVVLAEPDEPGIHKVNILLLPKVHSEIRHRPIRTFLDGCQESPAVGARPYRSDRHNAEGGIESPKIIRIGGDDLLTGAASADDNVSIHNIRRPARSK